MLWRVESIASNCSEWNSSLHYFWACVLFQNTRTNWRSVAKAPRGAEQMCSSCTNTKIALMQELCVWLIKEAIVKSAWSHPVPVHRLTCALNLEPSPSQLINRHLPHIFNSFRLHSFVVCCVLDTTNVIIMHSKKRPWPFERFLKLAWLLFESQCVPYDVFQGVVRPS